MQVGAVIAAAGMSSRMVRFAQLMKIGSRTMTERVIVNFQQAGIRDIVIVAGHRFEQMKKELRGFGVTCLKNEHFESTRMFASVKIGLEYFYLKGSYDKVFFAPADIPFFMTNTVEKLLEQKGDLIQPVYAGKAGHPILLRTCIIPQILAYTGDDGLRGALRSIDGLDRKRVAVEDEAVLMEADTGADMQRLACLHNAKLIHPKAEVSLEHCRPFFSAQSAALLRQTEETGSVRKACARLGISYSKGWSIISDAEDGMGCRLIERQPGGKYGGTAVVTERGKRLAALFAAYEEQVSRAAEELFGQFFLDTDLF